MKRPSKNPPREAAIVQHIRETLAAMPSVVVRKRHVYMGVMGDPDLYGVYRGRHFEMEVKRPGEKPTDRQAQRLVSWRAAGAIAGVVHSLAEAQALLSQADEEQNAAF